MPAPSRPTLAVPWRLLFLAALPAALHAVIVSGRLHPDEVYQSLEPAMHRAFGYGILSWEWERGLRNHAVPILFAWLLRAGSAVGVDGVLARRVLLEVPQYLLHVAMLAAVWRAAVRRLPGAEAWARWCVWLVALYGPVVFFGGRTMSESFSTAFLVWGIERAEAAVQGNGSMRARALQAGALLGLAVVTRYGSAAAVPFVVGWVAAQRRPAVLGWLTAAGLAVAAALGVLDWLTWGTLFHSFVEYVRFNVTSGASAQSFGASPWWYYLPRLAVAPWAVVGLLVWLRRPASRAWAFLVPALGYLAVISATAHKETRFVYPTLVLVTVAATPAFVGLVGGLWAEARGRLLVAVTLGLDALFFLVPSELAPQRPEQFQLERQASAAATGVIIMNEGVWGAGGFFYLGKNIPWCVCDTPEQPCFQQLARDARANRGLYWSNGDDPARDERSLAAFQAAGFRLLERRGQAFLLGRE